jgi:hypothetical protein
MEKISSRISAGATFAAEGDELLVELHFERCRDYARQISTNASTHTKQRSTRSIPSILKKYETRYMEKISSRISAGATFAAEGDELLVELHFERCRLCDIPC